ncbi:MAG: hypothetical protein U5R31_09130 [Acidimicrobiia bacterium]|nr:hypothetical protein [Acidimicrobiia bacterium]
MSTVALPPTAAAADVLQLLGRPGHLFPPLRWFAPPPGPLLGAARTVRLMVSDEGPGLAPLREVLCEDLDGRVLLVAGGAAVPGACWGEILSVAARGRGAVAALIEAGVRDLEALGATGLPVAGSHQVLAGPGGRLHAVEVGGRITLGEATVSDGDRILIDADGAVTLGGPRDHDAVLEHAAAYAAAEEAVLAALTAGDVLDAAYRHKAEVVGWIVDG